MYGYHGKALIVDLTMRQTRWEILDQAVLQAFIGGTGLGAYLLYLHSPTGTEALSPENPLIFAASPLVMPKKPKYIAFISQITFSRFVKLLEMMPASTSREAQIVWQESYSFAHAKQLQNMLFALYLIFSSLVGWLACRSFSD